MILVLAAGGINWARPELKKILEANHPMQAMTLILGKKHFFCRCLHLLDYLNLSRPYRELLLPQQHNWNPYYWLSRVEK